MGVTTRRSGCAVDVYAVRKCWLPAEQSAQLLERCSSTGTASTERGGWTRSEPVGTRAGGVEPCTGLWQRLQRQSGEAGLKAVAQTGMRQAGTKQAGHRTRPQGGRTSQGWSRWGRRSGRAGCGSEVVSGGWSTKGSQQAKPTAEPCIKPSIPLSIPLHSFWCSYFFMPWLLPKPAHCPVTIGQSSFWLQSIGGYFLPPSCRTFLEGTVSLDVSSSW